MYVLRRLGLFAVSVVVASILVFMAMSVLPGDPAVVMAGTQATPESVAAIREELGLDRSLPAQYLDWFGSALRGDLGESFVNKQEIRGQVADRLELTVPLALFAMLLTIVVGFPLGVLAASRHRSRIDTAVSAASQIGLAVPAFWAGLMLVSVFAVRWGWFRSSGFEGWDESIGQSLRDLVLPAVSLALVQGAVVTRYVRSAVLDTLRQDYIRTARAKGLTRTVALWRHGLRNAAIPVLTVLGLQFAALLAGTVVIENVFVLPGLGRLLLDGIGRRDLPMVQGAALVIVVLILFVNLVVDLMYRVIDPRVAR